MIGLTGGAAVAYLATGSAAASTGAVIAGIGLAGDKIIAAIGTNLGKVGTLITNNGQRVVNWGNMTLHGVERMAERGITQEMINLWVKNGAAIQQSGDKVLYITRQGAVVLDQLGRVVTAYSCQEFTPEMLKIIETLFGK